MLAEKLWYFNDMRRLIILAIVFFLAAMPRTGDADTDFGDDDFSGRSGEPQQIVVPEGQQLREEEFSETYDAALERDRVKPVEIPGTADFQLDERGTGYNMDGYPFPALPAGVDRDRDGLSDSDEIKIGTAGAEADTDGDGFADGVEVVRGYNPLVASPGDKITYVDPRGLMPDGDYSVSGVRIAGSANQRLMVVTGVAPANGIVMLFVYSEDVSIWAARADESGRYIYSSAAIPESGSHLVYAAGPSVDGSLAGASDPLEFEVGAEGVKVLQNPFLKETDKSRVVAKEAEGQKIIWLTAGLALTGMVIFFIVIFLVLMWVMKRTRRKLAQRIRDRWPLGRRK